LPYGTRLLSALVSGNCVGGSRATNARRYGVLISRNPRTLETQVIQRSIEELILSADRDSINPFLMPDDAIACYDSAATDAKEVSSLLHAILLPFNTGANTAAAITSAIRN
jgi:polysaccharide biosynthesis/export protein